MKKKRKPWLAALLALLVLILAGCSPCVSSYRATLFVHGSDDQGAFMSYLTFDGRMVFRLRCKERSEIAYTGVSEKGTVTVSCAQGNEKKELFTVSDGQSADSSGGSLEKGYVYVIVETDGTAENGDFRFSLEPLVRR